ncbi:MAG: phosphoglucosamine mutase, partial [Opitutales bacterium]
LAQEQRRLGSGRVFVRYSGTESKIRLLVEAKDETLAHKVFASTQEVLRKELKFL